MVQSFMRCIYCDHTKLYSLKTGQFKCAECKRKFSPKKVQTDQELVECFCENISAHKTSTKLNLNYVTVKKRYELFRRLIANFLENEYQGKDVKEYDEYVYLEKSKKKVKENIFDAQNFLTFNYDDKIYNILMPNLNKYKSEFLSAGSDEVYFKEFSKFMMFNKISKTNKRENLITRFWLFFEDEILKYKGVSGENFFYYLKEIEFKFNYEKEMQKKLLKSMLYSNIKKKSGNVYES